MATNYPASLDNFANPNPTDSLDSISVPHAGQHTNANDAIEAIEATLGLNPQGGAADVAERFDDLDTLLGTDPEGTAEDIAGRFDALDLLLGTDPEGDAADIATRLDNFDTLLGTDPQGEAEDVAARFTAIEGDITDLNDGLGDTPFGSALALSVTQVSAAAGDVLVEGDDPGEVDASAPVIFFSFTIDGDTYAVPGYAIVPTPPLGE